MIEVGFFRNHSKSWVRHVIITISLIGVATAVSMAADCLGLVVEISVKFDNFSLAITSLLH